MPKNQTYEDILIYLKEKYPGQSSLTKEEMAEELGIKPSTLNWRMKKNQTPAYKKASPQGKVLFPLPEIAKYLSCDLEGGEAI